MKKNKIKSIGILCSGGDAPGMNPAIRACVRTAINHGLQVYGIHKGYKGLISAEIEQLSVSSVGNIIQRGGTILQTARCPEFMKKEARKEAANILRRKEIDALVVIGGDGSFNGAWDFYQETGFPVLGIPGTIDNDIQGTEYTIGFDTAVTTAIEAVDRIRDTASSHARTFLVEVMGRNSPDIALNVGVCTGAENILFPGKGIDYDEINKVVQRGIQRGKNSSIIIVAEDKEPGISYDIQKKLAQKFKLKAHVCILGHVQRGGSPSHTDRLMGSKMGHLAVMSLIQGKTNHVTVVKNGIVQLEMLSKCLKKKTVKDFSDLTLAKTLSI